MKSKFLFIVKDRKQDMCFSFCILHCAEWPWPRHAVLSVSIFGKSVSLSLGKEKWCSLTSLLNPTWLESPGCVEFLDGGHNQLFYQPLLPTQERCGAVGVGPEEATKILQGLQHVCYGEKLRVGVELFSLEKRRLWWDLRAPFQYLKETYKNNED